MAKLVCPCGEILSSVGCPNEMEGRVYADWDFEKVYGDLSFRNLHRLFRAVWECWNCGRLAFNHPGLKDVTVKWYVPENGKHGNLMAKREK